MTLLLHLLSRQLTLLLVVGSLGRHLGREVAWGNAVDADPCTLEFRAHEFGEVNGGTLGGVVGEVTLRVLHLATHGRNGDDAGAEARKWTFGLHSSLQERQESDCGEVDTCDVCVVGVVPVLHALVVPQLLLQVVGVVVLGLCFRARNSSSADEQVDVLFLGLEVLDESLEVVLLGDISWADGDDGSAVVRVVGLCCLLESFCATTSDVDLDVTLLAIRAYISIRLILVPWLRWLQELASTSSQCQFHHQSRRRRIRRHRTAWKHRSGVFRPCC